MNTNSLSYQLGTSVAQYLMQYGQKELNYEEFKAGIDFVMNMSAKAKEEGEKFLAENAKREGVKTTASGLQYEVLEATIGQKPKATDTVKVHYEGTLIDGTVFDSSYKRGESISFPLNGVIKGWTEGLQLMSVGSKYKFFIPYQLAYGETGAGGSIPPYASVRCTHFHRRTFRNSINQITQQTNEKIKYFHACRDGYDFLRQQLQSARRSDDQRY